MLKKILRFILVSSEFAILGFFCVITYNNEMNQPKYVNVIHNNNLNKIANAVSLSSAA